MCVEFSPRRGLDSLVVAKNFLNIANPHRLPQSFQRVARGNKLLANVAAVLDPQQLLNDSRVLGFLVVRRFRLLARQCGGKRVIEGESSPPWRTCQRTRSSRIRMSKNNYARKCKQESCWHITRRLSKTPEVNICSCGAMG